MTAESVLGFVRTQRLAVVATTSDDGLPQAALMRIALTADARLIFDTSQHSRKYRNLLKRKDVAIVIGWMNEITVQIEGVAQDATGDDLDRCKDAYFAVYPDGRERQTWPDIAYVVVRIKCATTTPAATESSNTLFEVERLEAAFEPRPNGARPCQTQNGILHCA